MLFFLFMPGNWEYHDEFWNNEVVIKNIPYLFCLLFHLNQVNACHDFEKNSACINLVFKKPEE
jgi:hypothetical protein